MSKLTLLSIVIALVLAPMAAAADPSPQRGLKRALIAFLLFNCLYVLLIRHVVL
jgi:hypothetical protein